MLALGLSVMPIVALRLRVSGPTQSALASLRHCSTPWILRIRCRLLVPTVKGSTCCNTLTLARNLTPGDSMVAVLGCVLRAAGRQALGATFNLLG